MHAVPLINHPCAVCKRLTSMWCSRCQKAWYCSPQHISEDWPTHKYNCIPTQSAQGGYNLNMIATPPPAEPQYVTVSAIYFATDSDRPDIVHVKCKPSPKASQGVCPIPMLEQLFGNQPVQSLVLTEGLNGEPLRFPLHLWYAPQMLQKGSPLNRSIFHITSGAAEKAWCGPVVVLKFNGSRRQGYTDAGSNDLPALSAYFLAYK
ncbi:hypothetical protein D9619_006583 [Psilocybe cf. subviscida]|uniref:MYND-type domain-containing protein n=1 Tax=Psilocybe cf. subviscida TaxID=2480587 RepID=A0A8H5B3L8_9AGAR|nr:hypothetical protein D9619_006583 [Psilocybe cf. subviscida]